MKFSKNSWKETITELLANQFLVFWSGKKNTSQPTNTTKITDSPPSTIMSRMDFPLTPRQGIPQHGTLGFFIASMHLNPRNDWGKKATIGIHFLSKYLELTSSSQKNPLSTPTFRKNELKKDSFFSQDHHNSWSMKVFFASKGRTSLTRARNSGSFLMIPCTYADVGE